MNQLKSLLTLTSLLLFITFSAFSQQKEDAVVGIWETSGDDNGKIEIYKSKDKYFGKIIWLKKPLEDGKVRTDDNNPNLNERNKPVIGLNVLRDFSFDGNDEWNNGFIYDPANGKIYKCYMALENPDKLKVRGYIGFSLLGRTEYWGRVKN